MLNADSNSFDDGLTADDLHEVWPILTAEERVEGLRAMSRYHAEEFFLQLTSHEQADILTHLLPTERRSWIRLLPPDDIADILQALSKQDQDLMIHHVDDQTRREVTALLAYAEDHAGGLMSPRFARIRPEMNLDEAISYLKKQTRDQIETIYYIYVLDEQQHLLGVVSFRELFSGKPNALVKDVMRTNVIKALDTMDQEELSGMFSKFNLLAMPVVDSENRLKGIVTIDDIVDVVNEEATEDMQKIGGMEALDAPYLKTGIFEMVKKRGGWLLVLFLGEMLTASAMGYFEHQIAKAVVLTLFIPLIISSGGNSGSQASTLVIRAMALGEVTLRDWWRVVRREFLSGLMLGSILAVVGFVRIVVWQWLFQSYGIHYIWIGLVVSISLMGVVMFGTLVGSMLPFILRRAGLDPASASAPFVATLVDVSGVIIYFAAAGILLSGKLL